jgi:hypothetical protein
MLSWLVVACVAPAVRSGMISIRPKSMKLFYVVAVFALLLSPCLGQTAEQASQAKAVQMYPDLGHKGSAFNQAFIALYQRKKAAGDPMLQKPDWPMALAAEVASSLGTGTVATGTNSTPAVVASVPAPAIAPAAVAPTPVVTTGTLPLVAKPTADTPVTIANSGDSWTMDNGIMKLTVSKRNARVTGLVYNGLNLMGRVVQWESGPGGRVTASVTIDPATNGGERGEIAWHPGRQCGAGACGKG